MDRESVHIREARPEDAVPATALLARLGLIMPDDAGSPFHWERLWKRNPYFKDHPEEPLYGWVMEHEGRIVGFFGCFPRSYYLNGEWVPVAIASQWGVEKEFRAFTELLSDKYFKENPIDLKLVTTAIKPTGRIFEKYGGHRAPADELLEVYMIAFNLPALIRQKFRTASGPKRIIGSLAAIAANFYPWRGKFRKIKPDPGLQEVDPTKLPEEFDAFWQEVLAAHPGLIASRSADTLGWYYPGGYRELEKKVFVYRENGKIAGYAALIDEPIEGGSLKRLKILDLLARDGKIKKKLMRALIRKAFDMKADVLEVHIPGLVSAEDIPVKYFTRQVPHWPFFYHTDKPELQKTLSDKRNWHTSPYDGDVCLF